MLISYHLTSGHTVSARGRKNMALTLEKHKQWKKNISTLIGLTFAGINFRGLLQSRNSKDFEGIYFRGWDFFKNCAIFVDQILVTFFFSKW